jgi:uncharacterized protein
MKEIEITFPSANLLLEGVLGLPPGKGPFPAVVVCHPHPLYGGSMDNNVVDALCEALVAASIISFKFNFRGIGRSQGAYVQGQGEEADVESAVSFVSGRLGVDAGRIGLAGYSAGAGFACPVGVRDERVKALALVSPPLAMFDFGGLKTSLKPKLIICAGMDKFTDIDRSLDFYKGLSEPKDWFSVVVADHFWWGHEQPLAQKAAEFFIENLK